MATAAWTPDRIRHPINVNSREFAINKYHYYEWLREQAPVYKARFSVLSTYFLSRYDDCASFLSDPRFLRNRVTVTGGGRMPFPLPKSAALFWQSMITEDEPAHRRLRNLVQQAFSSRALADLEPRIDRLTHELLDRAEKRHTIDLIQEYALPIPVTIISELLGVSPDDIPRLEKTRAATDARVFRVELRTHHGLGIATRRTICPPSDRAKASRA